MSFIPRPRFEKGTTVLGLEDDHGRLRRITLHPASGYTLDDRTRHHTKVFAHQGGRTWLATEGRAGDEQMVAFLDGPAYAPRYLGYASLADLVGNYPRIDGVGGRPQGLRQLGGVVSNHWLTINRALVGDRYTRVTFVAEERDAAIELLRHWMFDRVQNTWDGEAQNDHTLPFTPIWADLLPGMVAGLSFKDASEDHDDPLRHLQPLRWVVTHDLVLANAPPVAADIQEFDAGDEVESEKAFGAFLDYLVGAGPHWRWMPAQWGRDAW